MPVARPPMLRSSPLPTASVPAAPFTAGLRAGPVTAGRFTAALLVALQVAHPAAAAHETDGTYPPSFEGLPWAGSFQVPTSFALDAQGRAYVSERRGLVRFHDRDAVHPAPVLDLRDETWYEGDRGLLSIALHPGFVADGGETSWLYALYTVSPLPGEDPPYPALDEHGEEVFGFGRLTRWRVLPNGQGGFVVDPATRDVLLGHVEPDGRVLDGFPSLHRSHTVGDLAFGADGTLLVSAGDGAHYDFADWGGQDVAAFDDWTHPVTGATGIYPKIYDCGSLRALDVRCLAGKVVRIDPSTGEGLPSNPFYDGDPTSNPSRVWALGLRNPFRLHREAATGSTDPTDGDPGVVWVSDVGSNKWEEINRLPAGGANLGWPCFEGPYPNWNFVGVEYGDNPHGFPTCTEAPAGTSTTPWFAYQRQDPFAMEPDVPHVDTDGTELPGVTGSCAILGVFYPGGGSYPTQYDGLLWSSDFGGDWVQHLEVDGAGALAEVHNFVEDVTKIVDSAIDPVTGDVLLLQLDFSGGIVHVRYSTDLTPVADLVATPASGDAPLDVTLDASGSFDPDGGPLTYRFVFGDGSPVLQTTDPVQKHTYASDGAYAPLVVSADPGGNSSSAATLVLVGGIEPAAKILTPTPFDAIPDAGEIVLAGEAIDPQGGALELGWSVSLWHNAHLHPGWVTGSGPTSTLQIDPHGADADLFYYEVSFEATATETSGLTATDRVFAIPEGQLLDLAGQLRPIAKVLELDPPGPSGGGQPDIEVIRDTVTPPFGSADLARQFDTEHGGAQGSEDWVGYELIEPLGPYDRFVGLEFQQGVVQPDGGWFESLGVEVKPVHGDWVPVEDLAVHPPYAGARSGSFESFDLSFAPAEGVAIRLVGEPGGAGGFVGVGELRVVAVTQQALAQEHTDWTDEGTIVARLLEQTPPVSQGPGNKDLGTIRNGTLPPEWSISQLANSDTQHPGKIDGGDDWIGYALPLTRTFEEVLFQEGRHTLTGGWFESFTVETRLGPSLPWKPVSGLTVDPPYPAAGPGTPTYETFSLRFDPVVGRELRLVGQPGGPAEFLTIGELRLLGPWFDPEQCGATPYGADPELPLVLDCTTPPVIGYPGLVEVSGAPIDAPAPGGLLIGGAPTAVPLPGGELLVDPTGAKPVPLLFDAAGAAKWAFDVPDDAGFVGTRVYLQAAVLTPSLLGGLRWSNGLELRICE